MSSTATKLPSKNPKRRKTKSQPVTSGSKPGTPGPSASADLNLPLDRDDLNAKSNPAPDPVLIDPTFHPASSLPSDSRCQTGETEPEPVLGVIGTPVIPSDSSTPALIPESKSKAKKSVAAQPPMPAPLLSSPTAPRKPESAAPVPFGLNEEFIVFTFPDSDEETAAMPIREWDQGKQSRDVEKRGKKRKSGEMSRDDREYDRDSRRDRGRDRDRDRDRYQYGERMENVPRYAPWIPNVDWDRCTNVAEL